MMKVKGIETYRCGYDTGVNLENNDSPFSTVMTKRGIHEREYDMFQKVFLTTKHRFHQNLWKDDKRIETKQIKCLYVI